MSIEFCFFRNHGPSFFQLYPENFHQRPRNPKYDPELVLFPDLGGSHGRHLLLFCDQFKSDGLGRDLIFCGRVFVSGFYYWLRVLVLFCVRVRRVRALDGLDHGRVNNRLYKFRNILVQKRPFFR